MPRTPITSKNWQQAWTPLNSDAAVRVGGGHTWWVAVFSGWGGAPNGLGGLYRTVDAGAHWTRVWNTDRVESVGIPPDGGTEIYASTETQGLWHAPDRAAATPAFSLVESYPFRQPVRMFFNPYDPAEMWVTSFGNSLRVGRRDGKSIGVDERLRGRNPSAFFRDGFVECAGLEGLAPVAVSIVDPAGRLLRSGTIRPDASGAGRISVRGVRGLVFVRLGVGSGVRTIATLAGN